MDARAACSLFAFAIAAAACSSGGTTGAAEDGVAPDAAAAGDSASGEGRAGDVAVPPEPAALPDAPEETELGSEGDGTDGAVSSSGDAADVALELDAPPSEDAGDAGTDTGPADAAAEPEAPPEPDLPPEPEPAGPEPIGPMCFEEIYDPEVNGPDYDQFAPIVADHCWGSNHQDIADVEEVVFLGDSVTVGTPNVAHLLSIDNGHFWRNLLAEWLAEHFGLDKGDLLTWGLWKSYDYVAGTGGALASGAFRNCAKWGARTDDLLEGGGQIGKCFPAGGSPKRTLVVFTMGGNDIAKITQLGGEASPEEVAAGYPAAWALAQSTVGYLDEALHWLKDPERFPAGSFVIFANPFEFTDGTGDVTKCPVANLTGFEEWADPSAQEAIVIWILEQFMALAVETGTDLVWLLEHFCGHGYVATGPSADPENRCYRGPDTPLWFDETCIHPNDGGHAAIYQMFKDTVLE